MSDIDSDKKWADTVDTLETASGSLSEQMRVLQASILAHQQLVELDPTKLDTAWLGKAKELLARAKRLQAQAGGINELLSDEFIQAGFKLAQLSRSEDFAGRYAARMAEQAEQNSPLLFKKFYPRRYDNVGGYYSPKLVAGALVQMVAELHDLGFTKLGTAMKIMLPAMDYLVEKQMPLFFVAPKLLEAVKQSDFQDEIDWVNLKLPYEHGCFVLPVGGFNHKKDGDCVCIFWSRVQPGEYTVKAANVKNTLRLPTRALGIVAFTTNSVFYDSNLTDAIRPTVKMRNLFYKYGDNTPDSSSGLLDEPLREEDEPFIADMGASVFGLFLAMNAKAGLVTPAKHLKTVKKAGTKVEYWAPNIIGKTYEAKKILGGGSGHASPRMHWRRGHFRNQRYGVGQQHVKTIWLEPCLIAAS